MLDTEHKTKKSYYDLLGVPRDATVAQIKEAYREIARMYHPDSNYYGELVEYELDEKDQKLFQMVTAAYDTLIKEDRRAEYDRSLPADGAQWKEPGSDEPTLKNARGWSGPSRAAQEDSIRAEKLRSRTNMQTFDSVSGDSGQKQFQGAAKGKYEPYCHFGRESRFVQTVDVESQFDFKKRLVHIAAIFAGVVIGAILFSIL